MRSHLPLIVLSLWLSACANLDPRAPSPVPLAGPVDLERFAGDWYLIAHIPTERDREAHNAIENYQPRPDGSVAMVYTNRLGGFDGKPKKMTPTGFPVAGSGNALWGIRFQIPGTVIPWPFLYEYRVAWLEPDYSAMIVARSKLDYLWLFAREPQMDDQRLEGYRQRMADWGYDTTRLLRVPQRWD
jgi:apolipoprotein D and lipocalin family protein